MRTRELLLAGKQPLAPDGQIKPTLALFYVAHAKSFVGVSDSGYIWAADYITLQPCGGIQAHDRQCLAVCRHKARQELYCFFACGTVKVFRMSSSMHRDQVWSWEERPVPADAFTCTCMPACLHAHSYMRAYVYAYMSTLMRAYMHAHKRKHTYTRAHACMGAFIHACLHAFMHTCTYTHTDRQAHRHMRTRIDAISICRSRCAITAARTLLWSSPSRHRWPSPACVCYTSAWMARGRVPYRCRCTCDTGRGLRDQGGCGYGGEIQHSLFGHPPTPPMQVWCETCDVDESLNMLVAAADTGLYCWHAQVLQLCQPIRVNSCVSGSMSTRWLYSCMSTRRMS